jgi:putative lipase involved disintegration of autophagic bodies
VIFHGKNTHKNYGENAMIAREKIVEIATLADLANDVYHVDGVSKTAGNWKPWNEFGGRIHAGNQVGFYARVYFNGVTKELIVAIRGTWGTSGRSETVTGKIINAMDAVHDFYTDAKQFAPSALTNGVTNQMADALKFVKKVQEYSAWEGTSYKLLGITGHSLGGGLSAICALTLNVPCLTFNPAPIDSWLNGRGKDFYGDEKTYKYVTNVITPDDPVSALNNIASKLLFNMRTEWAVPGYTLKVKKSTGHSMTELVESLRTDPIGKIKPFL